MDLSRRLQSLVFICINSIEKRFNCLHSQANRCCQGRRVKPISSYKSKEYICLSIRIAIHCDYKQVKNMENYILQEYIPQPFLLKDYKFGEIIYASG